MLGLSVGSALLVLATLAFTDLEVSALAHFNLAFENDIASWWSGALLLLAAVHAFDGYRLWQSERPLTARGWGLLSLILLGLSADEIASLHERAGAYMPWGPWQNILPFAVVLVGLAGYVVVALWRDATQRGRLILIIGGFAMFGLTAFQEYLEHAAGWEALISPGLRVAVEEGTELAGMLLLIWAALPNTHGIFQPASGRKRPTLAAPFSWRMPALVLSVVSAPALAYVSSVWYSDQRGRPAGWLAATLFALAAIAVLTRFFRAGERVGPWAWALAGASLFAFAASIALDALRLYALVAAAVTIAAWMLGGAQGRTRFLVASALMVVTLAGGLALGTRFTHFLALVLVGAITFWGNTHPLVALERPAARLGRSPARGGASPNREPAD